MKVDAGLMAGLEQVPDAVRALHRAFELEKAEA